MNSRRDDVSRFALSMAHCLSAGLTHRKALEASGATAQSGTLRRLISKAAAGCDAGLSLSDALESAGVRSPNFFLPVVRAGELGGRQIEAFQLIHEHCERIKPALTAVRNAWLYPLICILSGWAMRLAIFLYFGKLDLAWLFLRDTVGSTAILVLATAALTKIEPVRKWMDSLLLQLPVIGETQRRMGTVLFLATFRLVYEAGGLPVTTILDVALQTVGNRALREDLHRSRAILEDHGGFEDAFNEPRLLEDHVKSWIAAGALSGHLGTSLEQIVKSETVQLELSLDLFNRIFQRLVAYGVAMSVVGTLLLCLSYSAGN